MKLPLLSFLCASAIAIVVTRERAGCFAADADRPLPPAEAAETMDVPEGFRVTLFAGEPDVKQPIGFCIDDRGRLWVAEAYNYPAHGTRPGDRILIFEDTDGDGRFDKRTVFYDQLNYVTGIEVGFGGAWVMSPPSLYFIPDRDGDDRPDSKPQVLLDGFGNHANSHNLANGFAWGPDGWLYGTHGRTNWSLIGTPGTPEAQRVRFDGGVYRYHPVRHTWEPFADGTTNPWGIDFDDYGQGFVCNCVNPHLFHVIQGAHYEPWRNRESSQFAYQRIPTIADHLHFVGRNNIRDGIGSSAEDAAGGGHAHCGTMVYLGDNWPERYRNTVFMNNIHGRRINNDILRRVGSGYTAAHGHDLMKSKDPWYMGVTLLYGPDGAVFASDWSDTGECHSRKNTRRQTGRIYKISYGKPSPQATDVGQLDNRQLVAQQLHRNDWHVRHARRVLQERAAAGQDMSAVHRDLRNMFQQQKEVPRKLRALWALFVTGGVDHSFLVNQLQHDSEYVRAWAVRLLCEQRQPPATALAAFRDMADRGSSAFVRLHLASALQRLPENDRWPIAAALAGRASDAGDTNLPLMYWYAIEPLMHADPARFVSLASSSQIPLLRRHIARRICSGKADLAGIERLLQVLSSRRDAALDRDILAGILRGLEGRRKVEMPAAWPAAYARLQRSPLSEVQDDALRLALIFDDQDAIRSLQTQASTPSEPAARRNRAIQALVAKRQSNLAPLLLRLVSDSSVRNAALRGLAEYNDPETVDTILQHYQAFDAAARQDAVQTLAARPPWAMRLLDAVESKQIARDELTAYTIRQLQNLRQDDIDTRIRAVWGQTRSTPRDKARLIERYKKELSLDTIRQADLSAGRAVFDKNCANCHRLFGSGQEVGPDITGAQRKSLDYLLENLIDPSAAVARDYQMQILVTESGRVITGLVIAESDRAVTIRTVNEKLVVPTREIEDRRTSPVSMMPDGILEKLPFEQVRDLIAYLASPRQVPLPPSR